VTKERVAVYVDGFNMYHALDDLKTPRYKWLNLWRLSELLISKNTQRLVRVYYFTASPDHFQNTKSVDKLLRHRAYTAALRAKGVVCIHGSFAERARTYKGGAQYRATWVHMEEKKTDVALALNVLNDAYLDVYDRAMIICVDTDQVPTYAMVRTLFPHKSIVCVSPPERNHHGEIKAVATSLARIKKSQLDKALFGREVRKAGVVVARRPAAYRP
jgi:hypothetical protein